VLLAIGANVVLLAIGANVVFLAVGANVVLLAIGANVVLLAVGANVVLVAIGANVVLLAVGANVVLLAVGANVVLLAAFVHTCPFDQEITPFDKVPMSPSIEIVFPMTVPLAGLQSSSELVAVAVPTLSFVIVISPPPESSYTPLKLACAVIIGTEPTIPGPHQT
jgi:hypothetical protein